MLMKKKLRNENDNENSKKNDVKLASLNIVLFNKRIK